MRQTCIFSGSSHPTLVDAICERLGKRPDNVALKKFANGETSVEIQTSVRDQDVFIVQSGSSKINDNVIELLIMISACKGGSARSITAVMPYFPYSRQSKRKSHRGAITARMIANLMHVAGVNHVITIDLHASQSQGFFKCPIDNLVAEPLLAKWIKTHIKDWPDAVVVSKNPGGTKRVTSLADALKLSFGIVTTDRRRPHMNSMNNSIIFGSMGLDGATDDVVEEEVAEAQVYPEELENASDLKESLLHHSQGSTNNSQDKDLAAGRHAAKSSGLAAMLPSALQRMHVTQTPSSPLVQSTKPDSPDADEPHADAERDFATEVNALHRFPTAVGTSQPPHRDHVYDSEAEDDVYTDERARDVVTGRLIHGHIVDDEHPSPAISAMSSSMHFARKSSDDDPDPPENMLSSFMSTTSSHRPDLGLGGTAEATASEDEEEEALADPALETTITLVGNVRNRPVFIVDDIIDKSGSWIAAAETAVKRGGATSVYCMATHGLFGADALQEMQACEEIDRIVVTNAFPIPEEKRRGVTKLVQLDVSWLLSEAIRRNHHGESISQLFAHYD